MSHENETFTYSYSAKQQQELKQIRQKYAMPPKTEQEKRMEQIHLLDRQAEKPAMRAAILLGVVGTLLLGLSLCCVIVWTSFFVTGVAIGVIGIAAMALALPLYNAVTQKERQKIAPQILALTDELLQ